MVNLISKTIYCSDIIYHCIPNAILCKEDSTLGMESVIYVDKTIHDNFAGNWKRENICPPLDKFIAKWVQYFRLITHYPLNFIAASKTVYLIIVLSLVFMRMCCQYIRECRGFGDNWKVCTCRHWQGVLGGDLATGPSLWHGVYIKVELVGRNAHGALNYYMKT